MLVDILSRGAGPQPAVSDTAFGLDCAALCNAADAIGAALCVRGVSPGDRVVSVIPDGVAFLAAFAGTAAARAAFIPLPADDETAAAEMLGRLSPRLVLAAATVPQRVRVAASALGIPVATIAFDEQSTVLVNGEHVYESHGRIAEDDDVVFMTPGGRPMTGSALVAAALAGPSPSPDPAPLSDPRGLIAALRVLAAGRELVLTPRAPAGTVA
jgi:acyl-CoA synthetase (AMP-forming)/AMP-acid ligase II